MNSYIFYANILKEISDKFSNHKALILSKCQKKGLFGSQIKKAYSIIINVYKNKEKLEEILLNFASCYPKVPIRNKWLFLILLHEYSHAQKNEKSLKGGGNLIKVIKEHEDFFKKELINSKISAKKHLVKEAVYIRLIEKLTNIDKISCEIKEKNGIDAMINIHDEIPNLISLNYETYSKTFCSENQNVTQRKDIVIQGKSSCYPAWALMKKVIERGLFHKKFDVIDACAAPGNKTIQLSEYLSKFANSKLFAVEKDKKRFNLLKKRVEHYGINEKNIRLLNYDFLSIDPHDKKYEKVRFILLDPSCSGSGMRIHLFLDDKETLKNNIKKENLELKCDRKFNSLKKQESERILKLQDFQIKMLCHAMKFTNVIRICYSTCSIYRQENEYVVEKVLNLNPSFTQVNSRKSVNGLDIGFGFYGKKCLRANPFEDETDGFFIALFKKKSKKIIKS